MKILEIVTIILCYNYIRCNVNDYVRTDIEVLPTFETIIFSDLVDVINEFNDNLQTGLDANLSKDSEEEDSTDDLASKYQSIFDKTHKQSINVKQTGISNDIKPFNKYNSQGVKFSSRLYPLLLDTFYPFKNEKIEKSNTQSKITSLLNVPDDCYCEDNIFPCKCSFASFNTNPKVYKHNSIIDPNTYEENYKADQINDLKKYNLTLNINVNFKMPDFIENLTNALSKIFEGEAREIILGFKDRHAPFSNMQESLANNNRHEVGPKKVNNKKNRHSNRLGKRRKNKNPLMMNSVILDAMLKTKYTADNKTKTYDIKDKNNINENSTFENFNSFLTNIQNIEINKSITIPSNKTVSNTNTTENKTETTDNVILNFGSEIAIDNITEDYQKLGNSIEKFDVAMTELTKSRHRRQIETTNKDNYTKINKDIIKESTNNDNNNLLYWPPYNLMKDSLITSNNISNSSVNVLPIERKQIGRYVTDTVITNLTVSPNKDIIFHELDIKDVNAINQFIYLVGKYLNGILTLCSESECHSINCANKTCLERVCNPQERFNAKGHCPAKHSADEAVDVSTIDIPSTKAFPLIDDLKTKMAGKLFGKATLCEYSKCMTFAAKEKTFLKWTCTSKELTAKGHCPYMK